jgi:hypothetical protein
MAAGVRTGELSAAELAADALSAAAALDPALHFVDALTSHSALAAAARIDGIPVGQRDGLPLAGVPFLAKAGTTVASPVVGRLVRARFCWHVPPARPGGGVPGLGLEWTRAHQQPVADRPVVGRVIGGRSGCGGRRRHPYRHRRRLSRLAPDPGRVLRRDRAERHPRARRTPGGPVAGAADSLRRHRRGPGRYGTKKTCKYRRPRAYLTGGRAA